MTGASGFCGAVVARHAAAAGAEVWCLGRRPGPVGGHRRWDATGAPPDLRGVDAVVHLAAAVADATAEAAALLHAVNVEGTRRLLDAAGTRPVVVVSSGSVYAPAPPGHPVAEDHPRRGHDGPYGRTKAAADLLACAAGAVVLRPRAVYGPGDPHLLPRLRAAVRHGVLRLPGPDVPVSLTAVENLAEACLSALWWPPGPYNVADAAPYPRDATVAALLAAAGSPVRVRHVPLALAYAAADVARWRARRRGRTPRLTRYAVRQLAAGQVLDCSRAHAAGWRPRHDLTGYVAHLSGADADPPDAPRTAAGTPGTGRE
ncbi:MAG TPA: NAD-dependent epimerase/dehydratase family protein [Pilimelia sp.]|nr:NAD-dependent epimerase/dehydratase family protein [Pilimelia sp.]